MFKHASCLNVLAHLDCARLHINFTQALCILNVSLSLKGCQLYDHLSSLQ